jgi:hypothetical protein
MPALDETLKRRNNAVQTVAIFLDDRFAMNKETMKTLFFNEVLA